MYTRSSAPINVPPAAARMGRESRGATSQLEAALTPQAGPDTCTRNSQHSRPGHIGGSGVDE